MSGSFKIGSVLFYLFFFYSLNAYSQVNPDKKTRADSLLIRINNESDDTVKANLLNRYSEQQWRKGAYKEALLAAESVLKIADGSGNKFKDEAAAAHRNMGMIYFYLGNYAKALEFLFSGLRIYEQQHDKKGIATISESIGIVYRNQGNLNEALKWHNTALTIRKELKSNKGIASSYNNIGIIYFNLGKLEEALDSYNESLRLKEIEGNRQGIANSYHNISGIYQRWADSALQSGNKSVANKNISTALKFCWLALSIDEELGNVQGAALITNSIGLLLLRQDKVHEAEVTFHKSLNLSREIGSLNDEKDAEQNLSEVCIRKKDFRGALLHYENFVKLRDSIYNEEATKKSVQSQMQYEFDRKSAADSVKNAETKKLEALRHQQEISKQQNFMYAGIVGFIIMVLITIISYRAFRNKKKANIEIARQKHLVEVKQKEILDSIHYASKIQKALLTTGTYFDKHLRKMNRKK